MCSSWHFKVVCRTSGLTGRIRAYLIIVNSKSTLKIDQNTPITCCNVHGNQFIYRVIAQGFGASVHICLIIGRNYFHVTKQLRKMSIADREHTAGSINSVFPVMFMF